MDTGIKETSLLWTVTYCFQQLAKNKISAALVLLPKYQYKDRSWRFSVWRKLSTFSWLLFVLSFNCSDVLWLERKCAKHLCYRNSYIFYQELPFITYLLILLGHHLLLHKLFSLLQHDKTLGKGKLAGRVVLPVFTIIVTGTHIVFSLFLL